MSTNRDLTDVELAEARRIAGELVKLRARGIVKDVADPEAYFYATLIRAFGGSVIDDGDKTKPLDDKPVKLTATQRVKVPRGLYGKALDDFLRRDIKAAFGDGDDL